MPKSKNRFTETKYDNINKRTAIVPNFLRFRVDNDDKIKVFVISNIFLGSGLTDYKALNEYIELIKDTPNAIVLLGGNFFEKQTSLKQIKEHQDSIIRGELFELAADDFMTREQEEAIRLFQPIRSKIAAVVRGKQEAEIQHSTGYDPMTALIEKLDIVDRYAGDTAILKAINSRNNSLVTYLTNGGAESTSIKHRRVKNISTLVNSVMDVADNEYNFCDWYVVSTSGSYQQIEDNKEFFDENRGEVISKTRRFTCVNSWVNYEGAGSTNKNKDHLNNHKVFEWYFEKRQPKLNRYDYKTLLNAPTR